MKRRWVSCLCLMLMMPLMALGEDFLVTDGAAQQGATTAAQSTPALSAAVAQLTAGSYLDALNALAKQPGEDAARYASYAKARLLLLRDNPAAALPLLAELSGFLDADYQLALCKASRLHRAVQDGKFGYVDETGAWKVPPQFDWAERVMRAESAPERAMTDAAFAPGDTYTVAAVFVGTVEGGESDFAPAVGKYGLVRSDGMMIAQPIYDSVLWAKGGFAALRGATGCTLYRIADGTQVGDVFEDVTPYAGGFIAVKLNGLWAYLDAATGQPAGDGYVWESAGPYSEGLAAVSQRGLYGYIDATGKVVIPLDYSGAAPFSGGLAGVRAAKRWGFVDKTGAVVIKPTYAAVGAFQSGLCAIQKGSVWGLIDAQNNVVLRVKYSEIGAFDPITHRAWIRQNKLWGLVSTEGKIVLTPAWGKHDEFSGNTLCRVAYKGMYGFIDASGKTRILNQYAAASPFTADCAAVKDASGKITYIDKTGNGFPLDTDIPVECRQGFIEARKLRVMETPVVNEDGTPGTVEERFFTYALYDAQGKPIAVAAYTAGGV